MNTAPHVVKLLAYNPLDGNAVIKQGDDEILLIGPCDITHRLKEGEVEKYLSRYGFYASDRYFSNMESLVSFLGDEVNNTRIAHGLNISKEALWSNIIDCAPKEVLCRYLDRVEQELIPSGQFDFATNVIYTILESANTEKQIRSRAVSLLRLITQQEGRAKCHTR